MRTENCLIEIGTEELPPKSLKILATAFADNLTTELNAADLSFTSIRWHASPRRLAATVTDLAEKQLDKIVEKRGPALTAAFDPQGNPTKAAMGWARSNGIEVSEAQRLKTDKGEWLLHQAKVQGKTTSLLLATLVELAVKKLPIPKPMRWGANKTQFIRPVHTFTMLYGDELMDGNVLGKTSSRTIQGHRFHGESTFELNHADDYLVQLEQHHVVANYQKRQESIQQQLHTRAAAEGAKIDIDPALLDEVTSLVEWPVVLVANFESEFLQVPKEALIYTMKGDQKYFPLLDQHGQLKSRFLFVTNIDSKDPAQISAGNEKVIRPRLADARFFFETDKKQSLESRLTSLETVLFQKQLGTLFEKSQRISTLAGKIAKRIGADMQLSQRAGLLSKTDLMTEMVMEFPDVQGVMGMHYARHDGEHEDVATALSDYYKPRFSGDTLPLSKVSCAVALADKLDTLIGIFGIGKVPKGDKDPFALRRAAIGVLRITAELKLPLDLNDIVDDAHSLLEDKLSNANCKEQVVDFILARFRTWYQEQGIEIDVIQAVMANRPTNPADFNARVKGVAEFKKLESAQSLAAANKRVANILDKNGVTDSVSLNSELLLESQEQELAKQIEQINSQIAPMLAESDYGQVLVTLSSLKQNIDAFFDNVMVMADDEAIKNNRLALLMKLRALFLQCADVSLLNH